MVVLKVLSYLGDNIFVLVVVTAYNRRVLLPHALRSLERQSVKRDKFEVIIVKNFEDLVSDGIIIKKNGWRYVYIDARRYGETISAGVEEARGGMIAFLEDDDEFERISYPSCWRRSRSTGRFRTSTTRANISTSMESPSALKIPSTPDN